MNEVSRFPTFRWITASIALIAVAWLLLDQTSSPPPVPAESPTASAVAEAERCVVEGRFSAALDLAKILRTRRDAPFEADWIESRVLEAKGNPGAAADKLKAMLDRPADRWIPPSKIEEALLVDLLNAGRAAEAEAVLKARPGSHAGMRGWLESRMHLQLGRKEQAAVAKRASGFEPQPLSAEPSPYVGEQACRGCHAKIFDRHWKTSHARTLFHADQLATIAFPKGDFNDPTVPTLKHRFERKPNGSVVAVTTQGDQTMEALVEYAVGSGRQGISFNVKAKDGETRVHRISLVGDRSGRPAERVGKTIFQEDRPGDVGSMVGRLLSEDERFTCVGCHATTSRAAIERTGPEALDHSIGCENCHGPGGNHLKAVELKWDDMAMGRPKQATAEQVVLLCGRCHDNVKPAMPSADPLAGLGAAADREDVRLQSRTLVRSACFTKSQGGLDCLTCHDPHDDAVRVSSFYEAKCLDCHGEKQGKRLYKPCPVNSKTQCISCHMPTDKTSIPDTVFTHHHIRVWKDKR